MIVSINKKEDSANTEIKIFRNTRIFVKKAVNSRKYDHSPLFLPPINQRVLYDMPPITVTFYTLLAMSAVTLPVFFFSDTGPMFESTAGWGAIIGLTLVTFLSRLTLFLGVKNIGGMQDIIVISQKVLQIYLVYYSDLFTLFQMNWKVGTTGLFQVFCKNTRKVISILFTASK